MNPSSERLGLAQMAAAMTLSGTLGVFVLESGQSAWNVVFFRCVFGALSLFLYCWARGLLKPGLFTARTLALALAAGAALVLNWVLLFSAYRLASISLATAVYNVQPFFLIGLGVLFGNYLQAAIRNPTAAASQQTMLFLGMALTETMGLFSFVVSLIILFGS